MIFSWFSQIQRTNEDRRDSGFSHLSPESSIAVNDAKWKACHVNRVMSFRVPIPQTPTFQTQNTKTGKSSTILRKRVQNAARLFSLSLSLCVLTSLLSRLSTVPMRGGRGYSSCVNGARWATVRGTPSVEKNWKAGPSPWTTCWPVRVSSHLLIILPGCLHF